jgi:hypothetical protein
MAAVVRILIRRSLISRPDISSSSPIMPRIIVGRSDDWPGCSEGAPGAFCACAIDPANAIVAPASKNFRICSSPRLVAEGYINIAGRLQGEPAQHARRRKMSGMSTVRLVGVVGGVRSGQDGEGVCRRRVVIKQVRDVAVNFLTNHPEWRHKSAATLVAEALEAAFPCSAGR